MTYTVKEQITANLYTTLAGISALAGFSADARAERQKVRGNIPKNREALIIDEGDTPSDSSPVNKDDYTAKYTLMLFVSVTDAGTPNLDAELSRFVGDVRKALMQDYTRGGWAINTTPGQDTKAITDRAGFEARSLSLEIEYRTAQYDQFSQ